MRRSALAAHLRRSARFGHRSALLEPEGSWRPDRSPACPRSEDPGWFGRFHSLPGEAEASPKIRRPQPSASEAEAPFAPDELPSPSGSEDPSGSVRPAFHNVTRRPRRFRRAPHLAPPSTEATVARDDPRDSRSIRRSHRLRSGCPSRVRSEDRPGAPPRSRDSLGHLRDPKITSAPPSASGAASSLDGLRRSRRAPPQSEDPFGLRRCQMTSLPMPNDLAGEGQGVLSRRTPKSASSPDPAGSPRKPEGSLGMPRKPEGSVGAPAGALLVGTEAPPTRAPPFAPPKAFASGPRLRDREPKPSHAPTRPICGGVFRASPSRSRAEALSRSSATLPKPTPLVDRTSGRDGPESFLAFRGLLPAAIRHSRAGCLGWRVARSSPGLSALQGFHPHCGRHGFHLAFPSWAFLHRAQATGEATLQGVARSEIGSSLSRPPTLVGLVAFWPSQTLESVAVRESPPQVPGCVAAPCRTIFEPSSSSAGAVCDRLSAFTS
jgi:hypothetical protein